MVFDTLSLGGISMGTIHDWTEVVIWSGFFGIAMALSNGLRKAPDGSETGWSWARVVFYALLGLFVGIGDTFHWRALHPPIVLILLLAIGGAIASVCLAPLKPPAC
jgi:mannose/fructose/N-acetylgalactosamine-specific phosphotransferase system component IID